jgi:hypothetical protein
MPPSNFFGSLGNTNLLSRHGTSPRSFLNFADDTKVPGGDVRYWPEADIDAMGQ